MSVDIFIHYDILNLSLHKGGKTLKKIFAAFLVSVLLAALMLCIGGCDTSPNTDVTGNSSESSGSTVPSDNTEATNPDVSRPLENTNPTTPEDDATSSSIPSSDSTVDGSEEETEATVAPTEPPVSETSPSAQETVPPVQGTEPSTEDPAPTVQETAPPTEPSDPPIQETEPEVLPTQPVEEDPTPTDPTEETTATEPVEDETIPPATEEDPYNSTTYIDANGQSVDPDDPSAVAISTMKFDENWNLLYWSEVSLDGSIHFKEIIRRYNAANAEIYNSECFYNMDGTFSHWYVYEYHETHQTPDNWFPTRKAELDKDGNVITEQRWTYYSEQYGYRQQSFAFYNGTTLTSRYWYHETTGAVASHDEYDLNGVLIDSTTYYESGNLKTYFHREENGFTLSQECREDGQLIKEINYDPTIDRYYIVEYTYYPSGAVKSITVINWDSQKTVTNYSEDGQVIEP